MKFKRNEFCWCGSGLKYKKCHLNRERQTPEHPFKYRDRLRELAKRRFCFCEFDKEHCSKVYSASHSISKSGSLRQIAENSHVDTIEGDFPFIANVATYLEALRVKTVSVNRASTFFGFCSYHDGFLFRHLDNLDLSEVFVFFWQLFFRTVAFEKYAKTVAIDFSENIRDLDKGEKFELQQKVQFEVAVRKWSHGQGLKKLNSLFEKLETIWSQGSFDAEIFFFCIETDRQLPFACAGCFQPTVTTDEEILQRVNLIMRKELFVSSPETETVCIAAIPKKSSTLLCFCGLRSEPKAVKFIQAFARERERVVSLFCGVMMLVTENVYFRPSFLRGLDAKGISLLKELHAMGIGEDLQGSDIRRSREVHFFDDVSVVNRNEKMF